MTSFSNVQQLALDNDFFITNAVNRFPQFNCDLENGTYYPQGILMYTRGTTETGIKMWSFPDLEATARFITELATKRSADYAVKLMTRPINQDCLFSQLVHPETAPLIPLMHLKARYYWLMANQLECKNSPNCDALAAEFALIEGECYNRFLADFRERYEMDYQDKSDWS